MIIICSENQKILSCNHKQTCYLYDLYCFPYICSLYSTLVLMDRVIHNKVTSEDPPISPAIIQNVSVSFVSPRDSRVHLQNNTYFRIALYFLFCCHVSDVCGTTVLSKLQNLQRYAARIVTNSSYRMSAPPIIRQLGLQTVDRNIEMVCRSINHEVPEYLTGLFQSLSATFARQQH